MNKRVVIAMSGGVDSSVAAALLKQQGYECTGIYMNFWAEPATGNSCQNKCCTAKSLEDARAICAHLNMPFYVMNVKSEFKKCVVDYFLNSYAKGQTPNPCIECNRNIKFGQLLKRINSLKAADYLATGHYAKIVRNNKTKEYELWMAKDKEKDQSYFLYALTQEKLKKIIFPLGDFLKTEVYGLAKKNNLKRAYRKKESQDLCFFPERDPKCFLQRHLAPKLFEPGPIITIDGKKIGIHKGLPLYTIGQRHGLGIGGIAGETEGEGWYVVDINRRKNALVVGRKKDVLKKSFVCSNINFISGDIPHGKLEVQVRIRHRGKLIPAIIDVKGGSCEVFMQEPIKAVAQGQSSVFYKGEKVIGGGIIKKSKF